MSDETIIQTGHLCLQSGQRYLLRDIDWTVKRGEHWLVFGMNGSGKTTLLSVVAGFKSPTSGTLEVFGQQYSNQNILQLRRKIGWVSGSFLKNVIPMNRRCILCCPAYLALWVLIFLLLTGRFIRAKALLRELRMGDKR